MVFVSGAMAWAKIAGIVGIYAVGDGRKLARARE